MKILVRLIVVLLILLILSAIFLVVMITSESIDTAQESHYNITNEERLLLAKLVTCEASICSVECQQDIVSVVFNRLESGRWKKDMNSDGVITLYDIIYYPNAFAPVVYDIIDSCEPTDEAYLAVDYVVQYGPTVPEYVRYFRSDFDFKWLDYKNYKVIDNVYFGYFITWEEGTW